MVWGGEFRLARDRVDQRPRFDATPRARSVQVFSGFFQDEIRLFNQHLRLILGSKFEHNDFTGIEMLPNVRALWTDSKRHALWAAVSRALRLPNRAEVDGMHLDHVEKLGERPDAPLVVVRFRGNPDMQAEELLAYELGYRVRPAAGLSLDLATFYHRYDRHFSAEPEVPFADTTTSPPQLITFITSGNKISGRTLGGELSAEWRVHHRWRLRGGYVYFYMDLAKNADSQDPGTLEFVPDNPRNQGVLRSLLDLGRRSNWMLRFIIPGVCRKGATSGTSHWICA